MYIIYSKDYFLLNKQLNKLVKTLSEKNPDLTISEYSWLDDDIKDIIQDGSTYDLFNNGKLLIIKDCYFLTDKKEPKSINDNELALKLLDFNPENTEVILLLNEEKLSNKTKIAKEFKDKTEVIEIKDVDEDMIKRFLVKKLGLVNKTIDDDAIDKFIELLPLDMTIVTNEINKLSGLDKQNISINDVVANVSKYSENNIFNLSDYFIQNKPEEFIKELHSYLDLNNDLMGFIFLLGNSLATTRDVFILHNQGKSEQAISELLGVHPYRVKMILKNNHNIDINLLNDKIKLLYNLNKNLVAGIIPNDVIPELQLLEIIEGSSK